MKYSNTNKYLTHYSKGKFIVAFDDKNGVPLLKQTNGDAFQPIFTDALEFSRFNKDNKLKGVVVEAAKIPSILVAEAKGVVVNPFNINLQLPITRKQAPKTTEPETGGNK